MAHHRAKGYRYYRCRPDRQAQAHHCAIRAEAPEEAVVQVLQVLFSLQKPWKAACSQAAPATSRQLEALRRQVRQLQFLTDSLYPDWKSGHLGADEYTRLKSRYRSQIDTLEAKIAAIQSAAQLTAPPADFVRLLSDVDTHAAWGREFLSRFVERIFVHREKALTIVLRFSDPFCQSAPH